MFKNVRKLVKQCGYKLQTVLFYAGNYGGPHGPGTTLLFTDNNVSLLQLQTDAAKDTHNICHAGQYVHTVQHGNVSSHT